MMDREEYEREYKKTMEQSSELGWRFRKLWADKEKEILLASEASPHFEPVSIKCWCGMH